MYFLFEHYQAVTFLFLAAVFGHRRLFLDTQTKQVSVVFVFEGDHSVLPDFRCFRRQLHVIVGEVGEKLVANWKRVLE